MRAAAKRHPRALYGLVPVLSAAITLAPASVVAETPVAASHGPVSLQPPRALANTSNRALAWEVGLSSLALVTLTLTGGAPAETCSWCESNAFDRSVRNALVADRPVVPAFFSHLMSFGVAPVMAFAMTAWPAKQAGYTRYGLEDAAMILSTVALTSGFTLLAKTSFDRQRPAHHYGRESKTEYGDGSLQENLSFFSGDTSMAFSLIASSTTIAFLRRYPTAPYLAWFGGGLATTVGILRVAGDVHWATDVLAGAAVGTAVGVALPLLFHQPVATKGARFVPLPLHAGGGISVHWPLQ